MATAIPIRAQVLQFEPQIHRYTLVNGGSKPIETYFNNLLYTVPPADQMDRPEQGKPYGRAAFDADGDPIPGTVQIVDALEYDPETGKNKLVYDATAALYHILGLKEGADRRLRATSKVALMGVSYLPDKPSKDLIREVKAECAERAILFSAEAARNYVAGIDAKNAARQEAGMPPAPGGPEYKRAVMLLEKADERIRQALDLETNGVTSQTTDEELDQSPEFLAFAEAEAMKLAKGAAEGKDIDEVKLAENLLAKPAVRRGLLKSFRIRKVGHQPDTEASIEEMARQKEEREKRIAEAAGLGTE